MARLGALILIVAAACSRGELPPSRPSQGSSTPASHQGSVLDQLAWLPGATRSIMRMRPGSIVLLNFLGDVQGGREAACWRQAEAGIQAGYQIELEGRAKALFAVQGKLDRDAAERCAESAFPPGNVFRVKASRDGDMTRLESERLGTGVLWWRGRGWVVAGTLDQIASVRSSQGSLASNACMRGMLAALPEAPIAVARCDALFDALLGVPTAGWILAGSIERDEAIVGRVTVTYRSAAEAVRAVGVMKTGSFPASVPESIRGLLASLPAAAEGSRMNIDLHLTRADRAKVDMGALKRMAADLKADETAR